MPSSRGKTNDAMPRRSFRMRLHCLCLLLCTVVLFCACHGNGGEALPGAATQPAGAVRQLAQYLQDDDLLGYARAAVPPAQYAELEAAWAAGHSRWPLTELPLDDKLPGLLAQLSEKGAEAKLQRAFKAQLAGQGAAVRQAAHSLTLFGVQYLTHQGDYGNDERAHYVQLVKALGGWAQSAPLSDQERATTAIATLASAARATGLDSEAALQQAGMTPSLQRLGVFAGVAKHVLASYGLDLDDSLAQLRTGLVEEQGDEATVRVQYPLAGEELELQVRMQRRGGHWYPARTLAEVEAILAAAHATQEQPAENVPAAAGP